MGKGGVDKDRNKEINKINTEWDYSMLNILCVCSVDCTIKIEPNKLIIDPLRIISFCLS